MSGLGAGVGSCADPEPFLEPKPVEGGVSVGGDGGWPGMEC